MSRRIIVAIPFANNVISVVDNVNWKVFIFELKWAENGDDYKPLQIEAQFWFIAILIMCRIAEQKAICWRRNGVLKHPFETVLILKEIASFSKCSVHQVSEHNAAGILFGLCIVDWIAILCGG